MTLRTCARFPEVPLGRPHYESFYLKATHPDGGLGMWLRHTVLKGPGAPPAGSLWLTLFDRSEPAPVALKASYPSSGLGAGTGAYIEIGDAVLRPGGAVGVLDAGEHGRASWSLSFEEGAPSFPYLPRAWMYQAPVPRTKAECVYPSIVVSGLLEVGGRALDVSRWPGMIGHNWGSEHAHRSSWLHGTGFAEEPAAYLDVVLARVKLGPIVTPWIANGCFQLDGRLRRLGGLGRRSTSFDDSATGARFELRGQGMTVTGEVDAPPAQFVAWRYGRPAGGWHPTLNCSAADMRLHVREASGAERTLTASGTAAYEVQLRPDAHPGIALAPFPDP